jgi:O-antigen/teichoic acid export membrane protein
VSNLQSQSGTEADKRTLTGNVEVLRNSSGSIWTRLKQQGRRLLDRLPGGRLARHVAILSSTTVLSQVIAFAASPILTRLYSPSDFGLLGVYASILAFLAVVISLRYEYAIPLPKRDEDAAAVVLLALATIPVLAALLGIAVWGFGDQLIHWTNAPRLSPYLWLLPVSAIPIGVYQVLNFWAVRKKAFSRIASTRLTQSIGSAGTQIALYPLGALGLLLGHLLGSAAGISTFATMAARQDGHTFRSVTFRDLGRMALKYRRFPQVSCCSGLISAIAFQFPVLLLAAAYGPVVVGQFILVQRIIGWPMGVLGRGVAQVYISECASVARNTPDSLRALYLSTSKQLAIAAFFPMVFMVVLGPFLLPFVFGEKWADAGRYTQLLAPMAAVQLVFFPLANTLNVLERQTWYLLSDIFRATLVVASIKIPAYLGWTPFAAIGSYAGGLLAGYAILWGAQLYAIDLYASIARREIEVP